MASEKTPRRLGRGLDALFNANPDPEQDTGGALKEISVREIRKNPFQPRKDFSPQALKELQDSLKSAGLLQPITVRRTREGREQYELIAGERRLRAATELGWPTISAVVKDMDDRDLLALALVENLQRTDLNPVEEAEGYTQLITEFGHTQQTVASMVGRDRSTVANMLRYAVNRLKHFGNPEAAVVAADFIPPGDRIAPSACVAAEFVPPAGPK